MKQLFRKYHRTLALILCIPLLLTVLTGMATTMVGEWSLNFGVSRRLLLQIHTGEIVHLQGIYPMLNGIGFIGLLITGLSMSKLFSQKTKIKSQWRRQIEIFHIEIGRLTRSFFVGYWQSSFRRITWRRFRSNISCLTFWPRSDSLTSDQLCRLFSSEPDRRRNRASSFCHF